MQPAVPLWKVIVGFGRQTTTGPARARFFLSAYRQQEFLKIHAAEGHSCCVVAHNLKITLGKSTNPAQQLFVLRMNFSDLPSPAEASIDTRGPRTRFAQAGNRNPSSIGVEDVLFGTMR